MGFEPDRDLASFINFFSHYQPLCTFPRNMFESILSLHFFLYLPFLLGYSLFGFFLPIHAVIYSLYPKDLAMGSVGKASPRLET